MNMERSPLCMEEKYPDNDQIEALLGKAYPVYVSFLEKLSAEFKSLASSWMYYNDVKYWLLKTVEKKKTVFWLTVWDGYFKVTIYFPASSDDAVQSLDINAAIKEQYRLIKRSGKIKPVELDIQSGEQLDDAFMLINYKTTLK